MPGATGRGYATEAARRVQRQRAAEANTASVRVAERLGAVPDGEAQVGERRFVVHRHPMG